MGLGVRRRRPRRRHLGSLLHHCEAISINGPSYRLKHHLDVTRGGAPLETAITFDHLTGRVV
jgi:hypothetical protein